MRFESNLPDDRVNVSEGSAVREAALLVVGVAAAGAALTVLLALAIEAIVPRVPATLESRLFGFVGEFVQDEEDEAAPSNAVAASVQSLLDRLATHWSDSPYAGFHVRVLEDPNPNAFALPGGVVVVTTGLLDRIESENELAFVLGHELGHFAGRDHLRGLGRGLAVSIAATLLGVSGDPNGSLAGLASALSTRHFDRRQESAADEFGLDLLISEYGHAAGAAAVFSRVLHDPAQGVESGAIAGGSIDRLAGYLSTHPMGPDRIARLDASIASRGWSSRGALTVWSPSPASPRESIGESPALGGPQID